MHISCIKQPPRHNPDFNDKDKDNDNVKSNYTTPEYIQLQLRARKIEFISTTTIGIIFAICFAHLEYYYIKDPALQISNGKVQYYPSRI